MEGAADLILRTLEAYHLHWDGEVVYQSQRHHHYQEQIDHWIKEHKAYYCQCTRKQIKASGGFYLGHCREKGLTGVNNTAVRLNMECPVYQFNDIKHGTISIPHALADEDFIIKRRDGLFAYNLAVVLDDIDQGITEVVRGADLIEPTGRQISLYKMLKVKTVSYLHLPLAMGSNGQKLSKQNHAKGIDTQTTVPALLDAMTFLGFNLEREMEAATTEELIHWGVQNWQLSQLPDSIEITPRFSNRSL